MNQKKSQGSTKNLSQKPSQKHGKASKIKLNELCLKNLKAHRKRTIFWFHGITGLGLRVSPSGRKTWIYMYQFDGRSRMMTLGRYPKLSIAHARLAYSKAAQEVELGIDPGKQKLRETKSDREAESIKFLCKKIC